GCYCDVRRRNPRSLEENVKSSLLSLRDTIKGGAMKSLRSLIYASRATEYFHEHEIPDLLQQVRIANAKQEFTGMLLYIGGSFVQVLEGQPEMIDAVFSKILKDTRP